MLQAGEGWCWRLKNVGIRCWWMLKFGDGWRRLVFDDD